MTRRRHARCSPIFLARDVAIQVVAASSEMLAARHDFLTQEPGVLLLNA